MSTNRYVHSVSVDIVDADAGVQKIHGMAYGDSVHGVTVIATEWPHGLTAPEADRSLVAAIMNDDIELRGHMAELAKLKTEWPRVRTSWDPPKDTDKT